MAPKGPKPILYKHSHVAYQIKIMNRIQWCKNFASGACLGVTGGQKIGFGVLVFDCHTTPPRLFELEP